MIVPVEVSVTYDDGTTGTIVMYTYTKIKTGRHMNVIPEVISLYWTHNFNLYNGNWVEGHPKVSFVHTHPCTTDCKTDEFSGKDGKLGDVTVANWAWVNKMYLAESQNGRLWVYNPNTNREDLVADGLLKMPKKTY